MDNKLPSWQCNLVERQRDANSGSTDRKQFFQMSANMQQASNKMNKIKILNKKAATSDGNYTEW